VLPRQMASAKWVSPKCIQLAGAINPEQFPNVSEKLKIGYCMVNISEMFSNRGSGWNSTRNISAVLKEKHFLI